MSGLQDDWKDVRNLIVGSTEEDNAHQTLSEDWDEYIFPDLPRLTRYAYRVAGNRFENVGIEKIELLGRRNGVGSGIPSVSKLGFINYRVVQVLWRNRLYYEHPREQIFRGNLDYIDRTLEDALGRFDEWVEVWRNALVVDHRRTLEDIQRQMELVKSFEGALQDMENLNSIIQGIKDTVEVRR